jgi:hypothetical protein
VNKVSGWIALLPAYGRDYKSKREILRDFNGGKDFILSHLSSSGYINKEQIEVGTFIEFRYNRLQKLFIHKVEEKESQDGKS